MSNEQQWESLDQLSKDMRQSAKMLGRKQARYILDLYYMFQDFRKANASQMKALDESDEPNKVLTWAFDCNQKIEKNIKKAMEDFVKEYKVGRWLMSICAIGPVISAGLLARLDIRVSKTAPHFWRYAGIDPSRKWEKGQKCPWNIQLKRLCFIIGDCIVKNKANKKDFYGELYDKRKLYEQGKNERKDYKPQANLVMAEGKIGDDTEAIKYYRKGLLPPGHIHMRCIRWVAKIFLSHVHHAMYQDYFQVNPPVPYVFSEHYKATHPNEDHRHYIVPPNWPNVEDGKGLKDLYSLEPWINPEEIGRPS